MGANAESLPETKGGQPKRKLRNYLLDPRFQLKYTSMVVIVTVLVASVLGYFAYDFSTDLTESLSITQAMDPGADPDTVEFIRQKAEEQDRKVLLAIIGAIALMAVALGITGIVVTHRLVGPAYKMRMLLNQLAEGRLKLAGRLRRGDELQELFEALDHMVESLRDSQAQEVAQLDEAIQKARDEGVSDEALAPIVEVRNRMQAALD